MKERLTIGLSCLLGGVGMLWLALSATGRRLTRGHNRLPLPKRLRRSPEADDIANVFVVFGGALMCLVGCVILFGTAVEWLSGTADD